MYDEDVAVCGTRKGAIRRQSLTVCVFDDENDEPVDEASVSSEAEVIRCVARTDDWRFLREEMTIGDTVTRADGREYRVSSILHDSTMGWIFKARRSR